MSTTPSRVPAPAVPAPVVALAWLWVLLPFAYGVYELVLKVKNLFG